MLEPDLLNSKANSASVEYSEWGAESKAKFGKDLFDFGLVL